MQAPLNYDKEINPSILDDKYLSKYPIEIEGTLITKMNRRKLILAGACISFSYGAAASTGPLRFGAPSSSGKGINLDALNQSNNTEENQFVRNQVHAKGYIGSDFWSRPRELWLKSQKTGESLKLAYWVEGQIIPDNYWRICALLRDVRENLMTSMDPLLLDLLRGVSGFYEAWQWPHPIIVTSGFRTLKTNNALRKEGAHRNSMHLYGKAADITIPGIPPSHIGTLVSNLRKGGVGIYPDRNFVHIDSNTEQVKTWIKQKKK